MGSGGNGGAGSVLGVCVYLSFYLPPSSSVDRLCEWRRSPPGSVVLCSWRVWFLSSCLFCV